MPAYWWQCESRNIELSFTQAVDAPGLPHYIRSTLIPSGWAQAALVQPCPSCKVGRIHITYEFPRSNREIIRVLHIVGLGTQNDDYIPMMWETHFAPFEDEPRFDFKYIRGRSVWGLNKPAVVSKSGLHELFALYRRTTGQSILP